ncbi:protein kinase [bacterium]|nr:protein kinase [bacterium]
MSESEITPPPILLDPLRLIGRTLGDFMIERIIGRGGMGEVFLARQISLDRHVALKILKPELAGDQQYLKRFEAEARSLAPISHPNIVSVYAIGENDGLHFIALEFVRGIDLRRFIEQKGALEEPVALRIARLVASALVRAGEAGIVHRDIKPENVLLTRQGDVKVADFGLARSSQTQDVRLTQTGVTMGTPLYMSPEQIQGQPIDVRSDLYSLGIVCYQMLAGEPPFRGQTAMAVAIQHVHGSPDPLGTIRPDVDPGFLAIIGRLMAKSPADRYQSASDVSDDLEKLSRGEALELPRNGINLLGRSPSSSKLSTVARQRRPIPQAIRQAIARWCQPPYRSWFAGGTMLLALLVGSALAAGARRFIEVPLRVASVMDIPKQENGFMQYGYANAMADPLDKERGLWAVLLRHLGDDTYPLLSARQLTDYYLSTERAPELDRLGRYLGEREDLTMRTVGELVQGLARVEEENWTQADRQLDRMLAMAERRAWSNGETVDWMARKFFLADRMIAQATKRSTEATTQRRQRFWKVFQSKEPSGGTEPTP